MQEKRGECRSLIMHITSHLQKRNIVMFTSNQNNVNQIDITDLLTRPTPISPTTSLLLFKEDGTLCVQGCLTHRITLATWNNNFKIFWEPFS